MARVRLRNTCNCLCREFYARPTAVVARDLIGKKLVRTLGINGQRLRLSGIIVETEAYGAADDEASHARMGPTARNAVMFGQVGRAYVYFTYGNHYCFNISARSSRQKAGAVLIRAIEPLEGIERMRANRSLTDISCLASGPGRLTQALEIGPAFNGIDVTVPESVLSVEHGSTRNVSSTPRIGITRAVDKSWRFVDPSSNYISRRLRIKIR